MLLIVQESSPLCQWSFECFRFGHFYPIFCQRSLTRHALHRPLCALFERVVCLPLYASLCSPFPHLSSFPSVFILAENCAGLFRHIFPLSRRKPVSSGEDYAVKYVSFWYKAPKPHTSERGALIRELCQVCYLTSQLTSPSTSSPLNFPFVSHPPFSPSLISCS